MSTSMIVLGAAVVLTVYGVKLYNALVTKRNGVSNAWSDINVQLKRRYDLVPNLVEVTKGYKDYETSVLESVTKARVNAMSQDSVAGKTQAEQKLSGALNSFFAVAENYPDLKASENFQKLQEQLALLESDIQSARRYYNASVRELNNAIQVFPSSLLAGAFNFKSAEFFDTDVGEKEVVKVSF
ncbi:MAG: LemA family protein [Gammaproteobacteria bacterium]|nr:LemA family protein [Gammaproteobacteria bacterium]